MKKIFLLFLILIMTHNIFAKNYNMMINLVELDNRHKKHTLDKTSNITSNKTSNSKSDKYFLKKIHKDIRGVLKNIFKDNSKYVTTSPGRSTLKIENSQSPRATVLMCSDSRIQSSKIHDTPINDLFFVRNIGNQIETAKGSIEYGIRHLHTPVLLIIGHVHCGAIKAAFSDYSKESPMIRRELDTLNLPKDISLQQAVIENIHHQVDVALKEFSYEIQQYKLLVLGALYDFRNDYGHGYNRLIVLNMNGEKEPSFIRKNNYIKDLDDIVIGIKS